MKASIVGTTLDYAVIGLYFLMIFLVGSFFARKTKDTKDFFFAGQRFSWWMISFSMVATVVGSYSFIKYAAVGYKYGFSATQTYFNDWIWYPFLCFVWIPIIFFAKIKTIPEYFLRRFNKTVRIVVIFFLLTYLVGYVGINFYTLGTAIHALIGWDVLTCAIVVSLFSAVYVTSGGQNAVIMTDLMQGFILLFAGLLLLFLGLDYLGGWGNFVALLPEGFGRALPEFNKPPNFNFFGIFWQDAIAN